MTLGCLRHRRRVAAFVDGELTGAAAAGVARHIERCGACGRVARAAVEIRAEIAAAVEAAAPAAPRDWGGLWAGIRVRLERPVEGPTDRAAREVAELTARRWALGPGRAPRLVLGGALAVSLVVGVVSWTLVGRPGVDSVVGDAVAGGVVVTEASTALPGASVVVSGTPERDVVVVFVVASD